QPGDVAVEGLDGLRVIEGTVHAAAPRRPNDQGHAEVAVGAIVDLGRLAHELVEGGVDEVGELDLGDGPEVGEGQADGDGNDGALGQRRSDHALIAELGVQPGGGAEYPAPGTDVLTQQHDPVVGGHQVVLGRPHGVDDAPGLALGRLADPAGERNGLRGVGG